MLFCISVSNAYAQRIPAGDEMETISLIRSERDLIYWNRASNSFRKYGRNRDLRKLEKDNKMISLIDQIKKHYAKYNSVQDGIKANMIQKIIDGTTKLNEMNN